jgi:hypothetical protein
LGNEETNVVQGKIACLYKTAEGAPVKMLYCCSEFFSDSDGAGNVYAAAFPVAAEGV